MGSERWATELAGGETAGGFVELDEDSFWVQRAVNYASGPVEAELCGRTLLVLLA